MGSVLLPERLAQNARCTFGTRVMHGILQRAIRPQSLSHPWDSCKCYSFGKKIRGFCDFLISYGLHLAHI